MISGVMGKGLTSYLKIDVQSLKNGEHEFEFEVDDRFFAQFENSPVQKGKLAIRLNLVKSERLMEGKFSFDGMVELECDRSLELFDQEIRTGREVIFKFGDTFEDLDENTLQVPRNLDQLDLASLVFEFVVLALPMRKIHPRFGDSGDEEGVYYTTGGEEEIMNEEDPRWSALKELESKKRK